MASSSSSSRSEESEATDTKWNFVDPNKEEDTETTSTEDTVDIDATLPKRQGTPEETKARNWRVQFLLSNFRSPPGLEMPEDEELTHTDRQARELTDEMFREAFIKK